VIRLSRETCVAIALVLLLVALAGFAPAFFEPQPLLSHLTREAPALIATTGVALVIIVRQIDISIGSQFAVCGICAGWLAPHAPLPVVIVASIAMGALLGSVNGVLVAFLRLPSIVVTLGTMVILRESLRLLQQGQFVNLPAGFQWFGASQTMGQWIVIASAVAMGAAFAWAMASLAAGRFVHAVGSDAEAARLAGISPSRTTFAVFAACGALAGLAAVLNAVQSPQVDPKSGTGLELKAIAAAVVGGIAITGGRGRLAGAFLGLLLLTTINPALTHLRVDAYWEKAIQGAIILCAVAADGLQRRRAHTLAT
jgi:rhamnose transport system permease protein